MTTQEFVMRRHYPIGRIVTFVVLGCVVFGFFGIKRDLFAPSDQPDLNKLENSIYSPPTIANAVKFIADINTYLYHEARCNHISEEEAAVTSDRVAAGVRLDFPGWWFPDNMALKIKTWLGHRHIDDISCSHATVETPATILNNIGHYARRS